jgi:hypothetical protein
MWVSGLTVPGLTDCILLSKLIKESLKNSHRSDRGRSDRFRILHPQSVIYFPFRYL